MQFLMLNGHERKRQRDGKRVRDSTVKHTQHTRDEQYKFFDAVFIQISLASISLSLSFRSIASQLQVDLVCLSHHLFNGLQKRQIVCCRDHFVVFFPFFCNLICHSNKMKESERVREKYWRFQFQLSKIREICVWALTIYINIHNHLAI